MSAKRTYTVTTADGWTFTKTTVRDVTHAVISRDPKTGETYCTLTRRPDSLAKTDRGYGLTVLEIVTL